MERKAGYIHKGYLRSEAYTKKGCVTTISDQKCTVGRGDVPGDVPMGRCG